MIMNGGIVPLTDDSSSEKHVRIIEHAVSASPIACYTGGSNQITN